MTTEIYWLTLTAILTGLLALPYVFNVIVRQWPLKGMRILERPPEPGEERFEWDWGNRAEGAHTNAVENLVVFSSLVIAVQVSGVSNQITQIASEVYFWARLIHAPFYIINVAYVRTLSWMVGLGASLTLAYQLLA